MKKHPYAEAIKLLKETGQHLTAVSHEFREQGQHDLSKHDYDRACDFYCAAQFLQEGSPGGLSGPSPALVASTPPQNISDAALLVQRWFAVNAPGRWQFNGLCSRDYASDLERLMELVQAHTVPSSRSKATNNPYSANRLVDM